MGCATCCDAQGQCIPPVATDRAAAHETLMHHQQALSTGLAGTPLARSHELMNIF
jgi:hypothetical protein